MKTKSPEKNPPPTETKDAAKIADEMEAYAKNLLQTARKLRGKRSYKRR